MSKVTSIRFDEEVQELLKSTQLNIPRLIRLMALDYLDIAHTIKRISSLKTEILDLTNEKEVCENRAKQIIPGLSEEERRILQSEDHIKSSSVMRFRFNKIFSPKLCSVIRNELKGENK